MSDTIPERLDNIDESINRIERDLADDRVKMGNLAAEIKSLAGQIQELREQLPKLEQHNRDALRDAASEMVYPIKKELRRFRLVGAEYRLSLFAWLWSKLFRRKGGEIHESTISSPR